MTTRAQSLAIDLDYALGVPRMVSVWKSVVRSGLRRQPLADMHDFLDIHRNVEGSPVGFASLPCFERSDVRRGIPGR